MGDCKQAVVRHARLGILMLLALGIVLWASPAQGQDLLRNAGFEGPAWQTHVVGTSISSWLATDWQPWSVLGDQIENREVEYKLITLETSNSEDLRSHVHSGRHAQQFFTNGASHTAGFYQRVAVPANSQVTFTIWVQIQSGQRMLFVDGRYVSDLSGGGGNYWVQVGIDPGGARPAAFGAPLPDTIEWSEPLWDITAHGVDEEGNPADLWVPISVSARSRGGSVTVYTRGQCKYPTKYNSSFWDDASLTVVEPPTPTPRPPTHTPIPSPTAPPTPTQTVTLTAPPTATETPEPTPTPTATSTSTSTSTPTSTPRPTLTATLTASPSLTVTETPAPTEAATLALVVLTPTVESVAPLAPQSEGDQPWQQKLAVGVVSALAVSAGVGGLVLGRSLAGKGRRSIPAARDESSREARK